MLRRLLPDSFTLALLASVLLATLLPARGWAATGFEWLTHGAIALLFFLHGAKLSREAVIEGISHWRLHIVVIASTFVLFPLLGVALRPVFAPLMGPELLQGMLLLCLLPSTVQSSIAFTAVARGNVAAAVCAASLSSLLGILITPLLVGLVFGVVAHDAVRLQEVGAIVLLLLVPFVAGQLAQPLLGGWVARHPVLVRGVDQGSIVLVVYTAIGASVLEGLWSQLPLPMLGGLVVACGLLLALVLILVRWAALRLGFGKEDEIAIVFCGSKKSLASGAPMVKILFAGQGVGALLLPLMVFHQIQLMVCAVLARRYARRNGKAG